MNQISQTNKKTFDPFDFKKIQLNGSNLYFKPIPWSDGWIAVNIIINVGARNDYKNQEGIAHLVEHLIFEGSRNFKSGQIIRNLEKQLFPKNLYAITGFDVTSFGGKILKCDTYQALYLLRSILFHPLFNENDIKREKNIVIQEILSEQPHSSVSRKFLQTLKQNYYRTHPIGRMPSPLGLIDSLDNISQESISRFHSRYYNKNNVDLIIVGDINQDEVTKYAKLFFNEAPYGKRRMPVKVADDWPVPTEKIINIKADDTQTTSLIKSFRCIPRLCNPQTLFIANDMLYELMYKKIRTQLGAGYNIQVTHEEYSDHHLHKIFTEVDIEYGKKVHELIGNITDEITDGRHEVLFHLIKNHLLKLTKCSEFTAEKIAFMAGRELACFGTIIPMQKILQMRKNVEYKDVIKLFLTHLNPKNFQWVLMNC